MKSPLVSVIMPTYNHAAFVAQAIDSVLAQRGVEFELLIADDGSTDGTREIVAAVRDERIRFFPNEINRGACIVINELIDRSAGEFIALINSDDYWLHSDKLTRQLELMQARPEIGACFGRARFVDNNGQVLEKSTVPNGSVFEQANRSRGAWLRHFFDLGNCLCHPTMLIRKSCYDALGGYDNRLRQLPDFEMWVRLVKQYEIHVDEQELIAFRHLPGENASSATAANLRRIISEVYFILQTFFDGVSCDVLRAGFGDRLVERSLRDDLHLDIEKALLYFGKDRWAAQVYNLIGLEKIHQLLGSPGHRQLLAERYGINDRTFHALTAESEAFDMATTLSAPSLSSISGASLLMEVKRRAVSHAPPVLQPVLNKILIGS